MTIAELLADEKNWCKGSIAKNAGGDHVGYNSPDACRWCLLGAVAKIYCDSPDYKIVLDRITEEIQGVIPIIWNDQSERTHQEVFSLVVKLGV